MAESKEMSRRDEEAAVGLTEESSPPFRQESPPPYRPNRHGPEDPALPEFSAVQNPQDDPPSYTALYRQVSEAKQSSSSTIGFLKSFSVIILGTMACTICVGIAMAIPITEIVIGAVYFGDCPRQPLIPHYLIVAGTLFFIRNLSSMFQRCRNQLQGTQEENSKRNYVDSGLSFVITIWFFVGNYWIYSIYGDFQHDNPQINTYCNATLYYFAFWITTAGYIIIGLCCICGCCIVLMA